MLIPVLRYGLGRWTMGMVHGTTGSERSASRERAKMGRNKPIQSSNHAYMDRAKTRRRKRGQLDPSQLAENLSPAVMEATQSKRYRYSDLRGEERVEMLRMGQACARAAMTNFEAAQYFGVSEHTFCEWMAKDPEFALCIRMNRQLADERVERALYHRALGYSFRSEEVKLNADGSVVRAEVIKHIPPDVGAATFWLKNRMPHLWKDKIDVQANIDGKIDIEDKASDPRLLAMAVLDVLEQAARSKVNATIDGEVVDEKTMAEYTDEELEGMDIEAIDQLMRGQEHDTVPRSQEPAGAGHAASEDVEDVAARRGRRRSRLASKV